MESRRVQKVGYSTLSVSIPSSWAKEINLKPGDTVFLSREKDGSVKLLPSKPRKASEEAAEYICSSDLCDDPKMLERIIVGNYILGRDIYTILSSTRMHSEYVAVIRGITRKLIGLGIVEETPHRIVLQCSIDPTKLRLDTLLRRLSIISLTIVKEAIQALSESDASLANDAINREEEADMIFWLAMRLLITAQRKGDIAEEIGLTNPLHILYFGLILKYLELIADYAEETARRVIELLDRYEDRLTRWVIEGITNLNDLAHDLVLRSVECFFVGDVKIANGLLEMLRSIELERDRLIQELQEIPHLRLILWNITRIADHGAGIALIGINNALERKTEICWRASTDSENAAYGSRR